MLPCHYFIKQFGTVFYHYFDFFHLILFGTATVRTQGDVNYLPAQSVLTPSFWQSWIEHVTVPLCQSKTIIAVKALTAGICLFAFLNYLSDKSNLCALHVNGSFTGTVILTCQGMWPKTRHSHRSTVTFNMVQVELRLPRCGVRNILVTCVWLFISEWADDIYVGFSLILTVIWMLLSHVDGPIFPVSNLSFIIFLLFNYTY